jgi:hypothetical protein
MFIYYKHKRLVCKSLHEIAQRGHIVFDNTAYKNRTIAIEF